MGWEREEMEGRGSCAVFGNFFGMIRGGEGVKGGERRSVAGKKNRNEGT